MDLPESFFRAMTYGSKYAESLQRTLRFLLGTREPARDSLAFEMLMSAVDCGSADGVDFLLVESKQWSLHPLWWLDLEHKYHEECPVDSRCKDEPLLLSVALGQRDIFDRLMLEEGSISHEKIPLPCTNTDCWNRHGDRSSLWMNIATQLVGPHVSLLSRRRPEHVHYWALIRPILHQAISAYHQDIYFL
jgi:hypothetical protein